MNAERQAALARIDDISLYRGVEVLNDPMLWDDIGSHLNCDEAEAICALIRHFDQGANVIGLLELHASGDVEPTDRHHGWEPT